MKEKITILGAGISGLAAGWRFIDNPINKNFSVTILEKSKFIGGNCGTFHCKIKANERLRRGCRMG